MEYLAIPECSIIGAIVSLVELVVDAEAAGGGESAADSAGTRESCNGAGGTGTTFPVLSGRWHPAENSARAAKNPYIFFIQPRMPGLATPENPAGTVFLQSLEYCPDRIPASPDV